MTTKQFAVFMLCLIFFFTVHPGGAQAGLPIMVPAQTSITGCTWPTSYVTVTNGLAICPLNLPTGPALAIAVNGNPTFTQIPMTAASTGVASFNGRTGNVVLTKGDITATGIAAATIATTTATTTLQ